MENFKFKLMLLALLAGGCTPEVAEWTPAENPKVNKVERTVFMHMIHYPAHGHKMVEEERKKLLKFLKVNAPNPSAVNVMLIEYGGHSEQRIKGIKREFIKYGIPLDVVEVESEEKSHNNYKSKGKKVTSDVEIIIEQYLVIPPRCGDFSTPIGNAAQAQVTSNYGCADTANFGMMVANPKDLMKGRSLESSDGTVIAAGVKRYRDDKIKDLIDTSTTTTPAPASTTSSAASTSSGGSQ